MVFDIFPAGGFDTSIITIVFMGLIIRWILTETLGFSFVGLVVTGYLASVFIISPINGAVICVESIVTYLLVKLLSDGFARVNIWSNLFGRDRFFAFLFISIFVRLVGELWIWPELWISFSRTFGFANSLSMGLNAVGLVLTPLAANMFWKVGLRKGIFQIGFPTLLVYLITVYFLDPFTNLRFSEFQVHYEDAAIDMLSSPKPYIIILITAAIAGRANLRFGWDFGGIIIPALIAVTWQEPSKTIATIVEALFLAAIASAILKSRFAQTRNLGGPRKIVIVFTIGYLVKFLIASLLYEYAPHIRTIDYLGFGFLLSTLLALKIVDKNVPFVLVPALGISIVGYAASYVIIAFLPSFGFQPHIVKNIDKEQAEDIVGYLTRRAPLSPKYALLGAPIRPMEISEWRSLLVNLQKNEFADSACASASFSKLGLDCVAAIDGNNRSVYYLSEPLNAYPNTRGWGTYVIRPDGKGPAIFSHSIDNHPLRARVLGMLGIATDARLIVLASPSRSHTLAQIHTRDTGSPIGVVKEYYQKNHIEIEFSEQSKTTIRKIPDDFDLSKITAFLPKKHEVLWSDTNLDFSIRFELDERISHKVSSEKVEEVMPTILSESTIEMLKNLTENEELPPFPKRVEDLDLPYMESELTAIEFGILGPLRELMTAPRSKRDEKRIWKSVLEIADLYNLKITKQITPDGCWHVLQENKIPLRGAGLLLFRCERQNNVAISVPRPLVERGVLETSLLFAKELKASAILYGSYLKEGATGTRDSSKTASVFLKAHRVLNSPTTTAIWTLQLRGLQQERGLSHDMLISQGLPLFQKHHEGLLSFLDRSEVDYIFDQGESDFRGLRKIRDLSERYSKSYAEGRFMRIWISYDFRNALLPSPSRTRIKKFAEENGFRFGKSLQESCLTKITNISKKNEDEINNNIKNYALSQNPVFLFSAIQRVEQNGGDAEILSDRVVGNLWFSYCVSAGEMDQRVALKFSARSNEKIRRINSKTPLSAVDLSYSKIILELE